MSNHQAKVSHIYCFSYLFNFNDRKITVDLGTMVTTPHVETFFRELGRSDRLSVALTKLRGRNGLDGVDADDVARLPGDIQQERTVSRHRFALARYSTRTVDPSVGETNTHHRPYDERS